MQEPSIHEQYQSVIKVYQNELDEKDKEIERLNNIIDKQDKDITTLSNGNKKLKNIIDKLEKWLNDVDTFQMNFIENKEHITPYKAVLEKLQKLKEENK